ncbi:MAG: hypothetical protein JWQ26_2397, partial [Modestobacter sp.]|nr:hypothetical protein [Modestobacter sp.]
MTGLGTARSPARSLPAAETATASTTAPGAAAAACSA